LIKVVEILIEMVDSLVTVKHLKSP